MRILPITLFFLVAPISAEARKPKDVDTTNPNKMICRSEEVIGSRLSMKKTCLTAQQWRDRAAETRQTIDRVQAYKPQS